jgi:hypothetical protein
MTHMHPPPHIHTYLLTLTCIHTYHTLRLLPPPAPSKYNIYMYTTCSTNCRISARTTAPPRSMPQTSEIPSCGVTTRVSATSLAVLGAQEGPGRTPTGSKRSRYKSRCKPPCSSCSHERVFSRHFNGPSTPTPSPPSHTPPFLAPAAPSPPPRLLAAIASKSLTYVCVYIHIRPMCLCTYIYIYICIYIYIAVAHTSVYMYMHTHTYKAVARTHS